MVTVGLTVGVQSANKLINAIGAKRNNRFVTQAKTKVTKVIMLVLLELLASYGVFGRGVVWNRNQT